MEVDIILRGVDVNEYGMRWVMGEDVVLNYAVDESLLIVVERLMKIKQIDISRMQIVIPPNRIVGNNQLDASLKTVGISVNNNVIEVHPTTRGVWMWHPMEHYEDLYRRELLDVLGDQKLMLSELIRLAKKPPVLRMTTRVFLRKYPDVFVVETSLVSNRSFVRKNIDNSNVLFY